MYLLFKSVDDYKLGIVQKIGYWMDFQIGYLPDTHIDLVDWSGLNARVLDDSDVAYAYMFVGHSRNHISVRAATPQNQRLNIVQSEEATGEKVKYYFDSADIDNCTTLMKEIMRLQLDHVYDKRLTQKKLSVSDLEYNTWANQRKEAEAFNSDPTLDSADLPVLGSLAGARNISLVDMVNRVNAAVASYDSDVTALLSRKQMIEKEIKDCTDIAACNRVLHKRYNITMPYYQQEADSDFSSATYDL